MLFTKFNPPPGFYTYVYLDENNQPYYVGKGTKKRAWAKHNVPIPSDPNKIVFPFWDITELWATAMEKKLIRWFRRKDIIYENSGLNPDGWSPNGILYNKTNGGQGFAGLSNSGKYERTPEFRKSVSGENNPMYGMSGYKNPFFGKHHTEKSKKYGKDNHMFGVTGKNHHNSRPIHTPYGEFESMVDAERSIGTTSIHYRVNSKHPKYNNYYYIG
jgi:hypothetical protein